MKASSDIFHTLAADAGPFLLKERKSKFYGYAFPARDRTRAEARITALWERYKDATHICYAYRIGNQNPQIRANDDGEPAHSAGAPILGQIQAYDLYDVVVAVVRYYGGTKLGVGGLIHAYREAARGCLEEAKIIKHIPVARAELRFGYGMLDPTLRTIEKYRLKVVERNMTLDCRIVLEFVQSDADEIRSIFNSLPEVQFTIGDEK